VDLKPQPIESFNWETCEILPPLNPQFDEEQLLAAMRRDKKSRGDLLRFVVLEGVGRPTRLEGPDPTLLAAAYAEVSRDGGGGPVLL